MNKKWISLFVIVPGLAGLRAFLWVLSFNASPLEKIALSLIFFGAFGVVSWLFYFMLISIRVLPRIDQLAAPTASSSSRSHDDLFMKLLRINLYTAAINKGRLKVDYDHDIRGLPEVIKFSLRFHIWLLSGSVFLACCGAMFLYISP